MGHRRESDGERLERRLVVARQRPAPEHDASVDLAGYILTDGDFPNNDQVIAEIRRLNKDKKVKINTIAFMDRGEAYEKLLKQIADENGGLFKFVSDSDLQR